MMICYYLEKRKQRKIQYNQKKNSVRKIEKY